MQINNVNINIFQKAVLAIPINISFHSSFAYTIKAIYILFCESSASDF